MKISEFNLSFQVVKAETVHLFFSALDLKMGILKEALDKTDRKSQSPPHLKNRSWAASSIKALGSSGVAWLGSGRHQHHGGLRPGHLIGHRQSMVDAAPSRRYHGDSKDPGS